jgi:hypothetical protein
MESGRIREVLEQEDTHVVVSVKDLRNFRVPLQRIAPKLRRGLAVLLPLATER